MSPEMKKYREQISEYDCVPTSFINALVYLFNQNEIPAEVVRRIYEYTLDVPKFRGTTGDAIESLASWLSSYRDGDFRIKTEIRLGCKVHFFRKDTYLSRQTKKSCALLRVRWKYSSWHYITIFFQTKDGWVYCFDPYPDSDTQNTENWVWLQPTPENEGCNLRIKRSFLNKKETNGKFSTGETDGRELVIIERISTRKKAKK